MWQGRALGDPTRFAVFRYVDEAARPVGVAELTDHFGLNHNAIRQHLAKLRDAGLVIEELAERSGAGRRPLRYRPAPDAAVRWGGTSVHEELSLLLLEVVRGRPPREVGVDAGRRLARRAGARESADVVGMITDVARRQGFDPARAADDADHERDRVELVLRRCPLAAAATSAPDVVCELHRGILEGIAEESGDRMSVGLVVRRPQRGDCRLQLAPTTD
jgi:predicted ArsR family transcriptional regulator